MDLIQLLFTTLRRWYITLPVLAATAMAATQTSGDIQPEYSASASYLVIGPGISVKDVEGVEIQEEINPFLSVSGSLNFMADVLQISMVGDRVAADLAGQGLDAGYTVDVNRRSPVLTIRTTSLNLDHAERALDRLGDLLVAELDERQTNAGAPDRERLELVELSRTQGAPDNSRQLQAKVMVAVLGTAVAALAAGLFDGMVRARRRRRGGHRRSRDAGPRTDEPLLPRALEESGEPLNSSNGYGSPVAAHHDEG